jgi:hypothetical protein
MAYQMENGLYHVTLTLHEDVTNYVAAIRDGIIEGGDSVSCFSGTIRFDGNGFCVDLIIRKYAELDRYLPVFGAGPTRVTIQGTVTATDAAFGTVTNAKCQGAVPQVELRRLRVARADETPDQAAA